MSSSTAGKHAGSGAAQPAIAEPTFAERARTLVYLGRVGSLSTLSRKQPGFPFGSVMPYGLDDHANPIFLISTMVLIHSRYIHSVDEHLGAHTILVASRLVAFICSKTVLGKERAPKFI